MQHRSLWTAALAAAAFAIPALASDTPAHEHGHDHSRHAAHAAVGPASDQRHATDETLRGSMGRLRSATADALHATHRDQHAAAVANTLAAAIRHEVNEMIAHCELEPAADQRLHGIIGTLLGAAARLEQGGDGQAAVDDVVAALNDYSTAFDHPGWQAIEPRQ